MSDLFLSFFWIFMLVLSLVVGSWCCCFCLLLGRILPDFSGRYVGPKCEFELAYAATRY